MRARVYVRDNDPLFSYRCIALARTLSHMLKLKLICAPHTFLALSRIIACLGT